MQHQPAHDGWIRVEQQVVVGGDGVPNKGATAQRSEERLILSGNSCPAPPL